MTYLVRTRLQGSHLRGLEGRVLGGLFLLAFVAYGTGAALSGHAAGQALMLVNSAIVGAIGLLVYRLVVRFPGRRPAVAAALYLGARIAEAILLAQGVGLLAGGSASGNELFYNVAMLVLGLGSVPLFVLLVRRRVLPGWLGLWGAVGYGLLAAGALAELLGIPAGLLLSVPGGLFEVVLGVRLLWLGWPANASTAPAERESQRAGALVAGLGLLAMAALAGWANFAVIVPLSESASTGAQPAGQQQALLAAIAMSLVAALDVVVGLALYAVFASTHRRWALTATATRLIYAGALAAAITLLAGGDAAAFTRVWQPSLALFGIHLVLLAGLGHRSRLVPRWIVALVALAGVGYLLDALGRLVAKAYPFEISSLTFVGEVVLMGWLLWYGSRRTRAEPAVVAPTAVPGP